MYTIETNGHDKFYIAERKWYCLFMLPDYIYVELGNKSPYTITVDKVSLHNIKPYHSVNEALEAINFLKERKKKEKLKILYIQGIDFK